MLRPEDIILSAPEHGKLTGVVTDITFKGVHYEIIVKGEYRNYKVQTTKYHEIASSVGMSVIPDNIHVMHKMKEEIHETL